MALPLIKKTLIGEEFVIDERPEPISEFSRQPRTNGVNGQGDSSQITGKAGAEDLLAQISQMMLEQARLSQRAKHLETRRGEGDELMDFFRNLIPFVDNFEHVLEAAREHPPSEELKNWLSSVEALYYRIMNLLESYDLIFLNSVGKAVDLNIHDVVDYRTTEQYPHNRVIRDVKKGVVYQSRLLREAKVVVACNPNEMD